MSRPCIVIEDDSILRLLQVTLDPDTDVERQTAIADYYSGDGTDFDGWLAAQRTRLPQLFPATVVPVRTQNELHRALPEAHAAVLQDLEIGTPELDRAPNLAVVQKFGTQARHIDRRPCEAKNVKVATLRRRVNVACAEHAYALMLTLGKKICTLNAA
jgi:glyoxylate reductase/D-3-phosphoglycerate dehydrogenase